MQAFEERADAMLRTMGGSLDASMQRNVLRRLILAEDRVTELEAELARLSRLVDTLSRARARYQEDAENAEARLRGLRALVDRFMSTVRWDLARTDTHVEVPLSVVQRLQDDLLAHAVAQATGSPPPSVVCDLFRAWTGAPDVCRRCMCLRSGHRQVESQT